jgi:hypothetical protein
MELINNTIEQLRLGASQSFRNLAVIPLIGPSTTAGEYVLLDDALEKGLALVTEASEGGSVPELRFENKSDVSVLLVDGDELVGARQNRILNLTILVPAHTQMPIPVSCVEQGRWAYTSRRFRPAKRTLFAKARASKMAQVSASLRRTGARSSDQRAVWDHIAEKFDRLEAVSGTAAMGDLYDQQQDRLAGFRDAFRAIPSQVGAVFALNGQMVGAEFFDAEATFQRFLQKLLDSYAMEAIDAVSPNADVPSLETAAAFLRRIQTAAVETFRAIGEGHDIRLRGGGIAGGALAKDGRIVHLAAFAAEPLQ